MIVLLLLLGIIIWALGHDVDKKVDKAAGTVVKVIGGIMIFIAYISLWGFI